MTTYSNRLPVHLPPPPDALIGAPNPQTLIRPLEYPTSLGRLWTAMLDESGRPADDEFQAEWLLVTPRGHWYMSRDCAVEPAYVSSALCRAQGCGTTGEFIPELDARPCTHPATPQDIATALLASVPRPAPVVPRERTAIRFISEHGDWTQATS